MKKILILMGIAAVFLASFANASQRVSLQAENDFWFHKDCDYTHGTRLAYQNNDWEFAVQQNMYTPNDKKADYPLPDQHPYAGYLAGEVAYSYKHNRHTDRFGVQLGLIGPHTYAEQTQKTIHRWIGDVEPMGWDYQLKDEFIFEILYMHKTDWLVFGKRGGFNAILVGKAGAAVGLAQDYALGGLELRMGYNCLRESDNEIFMVADAADDRFSLYTIAGVEARAYAWNAFLDGNYSRDSLSVDSEWGVVEGRFGCGFKLLNLDSRLLWVCRSKEYETQENNTQFVSIEIGWNF